MMTGIAAVRIGIVMFVIPFVFTFYPDILLIEAAFIDPTVTGTKTYLRAMTALSILAHLAFGPEIVLALVLLASALARFDKSQLALWEVGARLLLAGLLLSGISQSQRRRRRRPQAAGLARCLRTRHRKPLAVRTAGEPEMRRSAFYMSEACFWHTTGERL